MTPKRLAGPVAIGTGVANVFNETDTKMKTVLRQVHVVNTTDNDGDFTLYLGLTGGSAAGTELYSKQKVKARAVFNDYIEIPLASTDFISGKATATGLVITLSGDQDVII